MFDSLIVSWVFLTEWKITFRDMKVCESVKILRSYELTITLMIKSVALYTDSIITLFRMTREELKKIRELSDTPM